MNQERYHLTLAVDGQPMLHGWWGSEEIARRKLTAWIGERGKAGARITLTDEATGETLTSWPDKA